MVNATISFAFLTLNTPFGLVHIDFSLNPLIHIEPTKAVNYQICQFILNRGLTYIVTLASKNETGGISESL